MVPCDGTTPQRMLESGVVIPEMYGRYTGHLVGAMPHDASSQTPALSSDKSPTVFHRDRQQPTMARVYVGDGNSLELVSLQVTSTIEGPRARTVVDHIFRNPHDKQLEGTFEYPLPTGASPSYFAMFLGQTRDTVPARFGRRDVAALPADALAKLTPEQLVKHVDSGRLGRAAGRPRRQQGEGAGNLRGDRPRPHRSGAAGIRRRQHLPRPRLPDPAEGLQPRPPRL